MFFLLPPLLPLLHLITLTGQSKLTTARNEADQVKILSGTEFGKTLGTPIGLLVRSYTALLSHFKHALLRVSPTLPGCAKAISSWIKPFLRG